MMTFNPVVENTTPTIAAITITPITKLTHPEPTKNPRRDSSSTDSNQTDRQSVTKQYLVRRKKNPSDC